MNRLNRRTFCSLLAAGTGAGMAVSRAIKGHALAEAQYMGRYERR